MKIYIATTMPEKSLLEIRLNTLIEKQYGLYDQVSLYSNTISQNEKTAG